MRTGLGHSITPLRQQHAAIGRFYTHERFEMLDLEYQNMIASGVCHAADMMKVTVQEVALRYATPSAIFRPRISIDGDKWCALYGDNIQDGVAGFGDTPALAMHAFDKEWDSRRVGQ